LLLDFFHSSLQVLAFLIMTWVLSEPLPVLSNAEYELLDFWQNSFVRFLLYSTAVKFLILPT